MILSASALMLLLMLAGMGGASAETFVEANVTSTAEWNEAGSPYIVNETIYVLAGQTLTIGPGVTVLFAPDAGIVVNGTLAVKGAAANMVVFDEKDASLGWAGLVFNEGSEGNIDHALINNTECAIDVTDCKLAVTNTAITNTAKAIYAEFDLGGSLTVDNCYIDAQSGPGASIAVYMSGFADGVYKNVIAVDVSITNNLVNSTNSEGLLYISRYVEAEGNGIATVMGNIVVSGNELNLFASEGHLAHFYDRVYAVGDATATIEGSITYADNQACISSPSSLDYMTYFERDVAGNDNSTASLIGDILISDNTFNQASMDSDLIYMNVVLYAYNNATASIEGDFTAVRNEMFQAGDHTCDLCFEIWSGNDNSTASLIGDILIEDNLIEKVNHGPYVHIGPGSDGYGRVCIVGDVVMNGNEIEYARYTGAYYYCSIYATDNSAVSVVGDVVMNGNEIEYARYTGAYYYCSIYATDNSAVSVVGDVVMNGNSLEHIEYGDGAFTAGWQVDEAHDNATVEVEASLTIENNWVGTTMGAFSVGTIIGDPWQHTPNAVSQDAEVLLLVDMVIVNNVVEHANYNILEAYFTTGSAVAERASACIDVSLRFEGNEVFCVENNGNAAIAIHRSAVASGEASAVVLADICIVNNIVEAAYWSCLYLGDHAAVNDDASVELLGDVTVFGNDFTMDAMPGEPASLEGEYAWIIVERDHSLSMNGSVRVSSDVTVENNDLAGYLEHGLFMRVDVRYGSVENTTLAYCGDLTVRCNTFENCYGNAVRYVVNLDAPWYGKVDYDGAVTIEGNVAEELMGFAFFVRQRFAAGDFGELCANFPVCVSGNTITAAKGLLHYDGRYGASEEAVLGYVGDVCVLGNVCDDLDANMVRYKVDGGADGSARVTIRNALTVGGNVADAMLNGVVYEIAVHADGLAGIEADMPLTATCNTLTVGRSMVEADVKVGAYGDATALLCNDVLVQGNRMEGEYHEAPTAPTGKGYSGYGLKLFQNLSVEAYDVLASGTIRSKVLFDQNTIVGYGLVGMNVYRNAKAYGYGADALACIAGDVTATKNILDIQGTGCGLAGGAEVYAYESGGNASATVDTLFCFSQNKVTMEYGHGIVAYSEDGSEDYGADDVQEHSAISVNDLAYLIENNRVNRPEGAISGLANGYLGPYAIYVDVDEYVPVTVSGNTIDMVAGTGIYVRSGDVAIRKNNISIEESGRGIWIEGGKVIVDDCCLNVGEYAIYITADGVVVKNSKLFNIQGTGLYILMCDGVLIDNVMVTGAVNGILAEHCSNLTVCGCVFQENDNGATFRGLENSTVCHSKFLRNNGNGAGFDGCGNLLVECCVFSNNGNDGAQFYNMGFDKPLVIRDCTFEENEEDGLFLSSIYDVTIWNGVFRNNVDHGISANDAYLVWNVDGAADVKNNDVRLFGAKIFVLGGGALTLDCIDSFYVQGYDLNDAPVEFKDGRGKLQVNEGGSFVARNVQFGASSFLLWVYGCMNMMDCYIYDIETVYLAPTSQAELTTTTIEDAGLNGIYIDGCSPVIRGCVIRYAEMDGIFVKGANAKPAIMNTLFIGNQRGIYAYGSCLDKVLDNVFLSNEVAGIYAEKVAGLIHDNVFLFNQKEIFLVDCDVAVMYNEIGYGRLIKMQEPMASLIAQALVDLVKVNINLEIYSGFDAPAQPFGMGGLEDLFTYMFDDHIGIYAVDSCVVAKGNEYGMLQYALYAIGSEVEFSDTVKANTFDIEYTSENSSRKLSIPFRVYDGIFATDSKLTIVGACFQVVDDAIFLEASEAMVMNTVFEAGDFDLYLMDGSMAAMAGELGRYAILDTSMLYWLGELTITVVDQDSFGIAGASVVVKDASGRVWSDGVTDRHGVFLAYAPYSLETVSGVNDTLGKTVVTASYGDKATKSAEIDVDGDEQLTMKMTIKESSIFGTNPLVLGVVALVIVAVIVGAVLLARKD